MFFRFLLWFFLRKIARILAVHSTLFFKGRWKYPLCLWPCYRSDLQLSTMEHLDVLAVVDCWCQQMIELSPANDWIQIFENKGAIMGCSNPHPHCQIWCCSK